MTFLRSFRAFGDGTDPTSSPCPPPAAPPPHPKRSPKHRLSPLARSPHPLRPAGPSAAGVRLLDPTEFPDGTSRRPVYLPRGIEELETCCLNQREAALSTGFYRDALRTDEGMLSRLAWQELPTP